MSNVQQRPFTLAIIQEVRGLERLGEKQRRKMDRALDVDGDGQVSYLAEYGGATTYIRANYARHDGANGLRLLPGVRPNEVVADLGARKRAIVGIADQFADQTFAAGRASGARALYFGGFFDSNVRTLKDEIREVAHRLPSMALLKKLRSIVDATPRNAEGKIDFQLWDAHLFTALQEQLGVRPWGRLLHGSMWGDL